MLSASFGRRVDGVVFNEFENTFGDPPEVRVFACGDIDAINVGEGDKPPYEINCRHAEFEQLHGIS